MGSTEGLSMIAHKNSLTDNAAATTETPRARGGIERLPWDNLRLFLAVAEAGSFRSAAVLAGVSINTIRSKVERLERQIGGPLLRRSVEGVALTQDGREILQIAREMRELGRTTARVAHGAASANAAIRIVATEGVGTAWLVPQLAALQSKDAGLRLSLDCGSHASDVLFRDVDFSIQVDRPSDPVLTVERVATLHIMPFASPAYVAAHGLPQSAADTANHRLVWQTSNPLGDELMGSFLDEAARRKLVTFETSTSMSHYFAVASGAGIGFLPTYAVHLDPSLVPVDIGIVLQRDVYLVCHADNDDKPGIGKVREWLATAFDAARFPCFGAQFVHPSELAADGVAALFAGKPRR
jgi:DNA-binding transcriptional LysR family regulator